MNSGTMCRTCLGLCPECIAWSKPGPIKPTLYQSALNCRLTATLAFGAIPPPNAGSWIKATLNQPLTPPLPWVMIDCNEWRPVASARKHSLTELQPSACAGSTVGSSPVTSRPVILLATGRVNCPARLLGVIGCEVYTHVFRALARQRRPERVVSDDSGVIGHEAIHSRVRTSG